MNLFNNKNFLLFAVFLDKSYIWEKFCSWDIGQSTLSQSGCRIFKSSISSEQINETVLFLACWYKFKTINSWWNIFSWVWSKMGLIKNGFQKSDLWTVSQEWTDGIDTDSQKLKADQNFVRWVWSKLGLANLVTGL